MSVQMNSEFEAIEKSLTEEYYQLFNNPQISPSPQGMYHPVDSLMSFEGEGEESTEKIFEKFNTIMVGSDYQADIPENLFKYDDVMPYENEDKLLWDPHNLSDKDVENYLSIIQANVQTSPVDIINRIPKGSHIKDDEQALYLLLQCGQNVDEAIRRRSITDSSSINSSLWSEEECRNFESGLRQYGKDFHSIQQNRVITRSVSELVQFYYLWKKTERHDLFALKARLEKKKYILHPGTTNFMERFLDDNDSPSNSPNINSLISGDPKRQTNKTSPSPSPIPQQSASHQQLPSTTNNNNNNNSLTIINFEQEDSNNRSSSKRNDIVDTNRSTPHSLSNKPNVSSSVLVEHYEKLMKL